MNIYAVSGSTAEIGFTKKYNPIHTINKDKTCAPDKISNRYFSFVRKNSTKNLSNPAKMRY